MAGGQEQAHDLHDVVVGHALREEQARDRILGGIERARLPIGDDFGGVVVQQPARLLHLLRVVSSPLLVLEELLRPRLEEAPGAVGKVEERGEAF